MTIKEIAKMAGVSVATVSLALNNKGAVKEETKNLILEIANRTGYTKKNTELKKNILMIKYVSSGIPINQNGDFISRLIDAMECTASGMHYNLVIKNIEADQFETEISSGNFEEFSGIIFLATEADLDTIKHLEKLMIPVVAVDNLFEHIDVDAVVMDNRSGVYLAMQYLYKMGHKVIGYVDSTIPFRNMIERREGYERALLELGLENKSNIITVTPTLEGAYEDVLKILESGRLEPTAYVAANDMIAIGMIKALKTYDYAIPQDISIIGFDDIPFCNVLDKPLTTMRVNKEKLGKLAITILDRKIRSEDEEEGPIKVLVGTKLIERDSVCKRI